MDRKLLSLNQSRLKWIAVISMIIDHIGYAFYSVLPHPVYQTMRAAGRMAFPIFAFVLAEGFFHTRNPRRHLLLLGLFAVLSEVPFNLLMDSRMFSVRHQSVMLTMLIGFAGMMMLHHLKGAWRLTALALPFAADLLHTDYGATGILTIYLFYMIAVSRPEGLRRASAPELLPAFLPLFAYALVSWRTEAACILSVPLLMHYSGERGRSSKYFFYVIYPAHLLLIVLIRNWVLHGQIIFP